MQNCGNITKPKTRVYNYLAGFNLFKDPPAVISDDTVFWPKHFIKNTKLYFYTTPEGNLVFEKPKGPPLSWETYVNRELRSSLAQIYGMNLPDNINIVEFVYPKEGLTKYIDSYIKFNDEVLERIERFAYEYPQELVPPQIEESDKLEPDDFTEAESPSPILNEAGQYQFFPQDPKSLKDAKKHKQAVKQNIENNLPQEVASTIEVVDVVPEDILGRDDLYLSMKDILEKVGITDPLLINWLGINKAVVNVRAVKSTEQLNSIITKSYNQRIQQAKPFLKKAAEVQFNEWVNELQKYPIAFGDAILKYAIKNLINPKRRNKFVISFSETALSNTFRDVTNQPHKLNQVGSIYNSELLKLTSDATEHEPSASGKGYWVHVPRVEKKSDFNTYDRFELNGNSYTKIDTYRKNEKEISKEEYNKAIEDYKKQTPDINAQYKANVELLRKLSPQTWCTASTMADYYVQNYDNYLLIVDGKTVAGIEAGIDNRSSQRLHGTKVFYLLKSDGYLKDGYAIYSNRKEEFDDKTLITNETTKNPSGVEFTYVNLKKEDRKIPVKEVTSRANNGIAPIDYLDDILAFFEKHNLNPSNQSIQNAMRARENGKTDADVMGEYDYDPDFYPAYEPDYDFYEVEAQYEEFINQGVETAQNLQTVEETLDFLRIYREHPIVYERINPNMLRNEQVVSNLLDYNPNSIVFIDATLPFYEEAALKAIRLDPQTFNYVSDSIRENPQAIALYEDYLEATRQRVAGYFNPGVFARIREVYPNENYASIVNPGSITLGLLDELEREGRPFSYLREYPDYLPFSKTRNKQIQGYYDAKTDKVVVVASNVKINEAAKVGIHEVAHRGMLRMAKDLGGSQALYEALSAAKTQLISKLPELLNRTGHKTLNSLILDYGFNPNTQEGEFKLLMELAARWAETLVNKPKPSWWKKLLQNIGQWLKQFTGITLNEDQVNALVGGFVQYGTTKTIATFEEEIQLSKVAFPSPVKPGVAELFESKRSFADYSDFGKTLSEQEIINLKKEGNKVTAKQFLESIIPVNDFEKKLKSFLLSIDLNKLNGFDFVINDKYQGNIIGLNERDLFEKPTVIFNSKSTTQPSRYKLHEFLHSLLDTVVNEEQEFRTELISLFDYVKTLPEFKNEYGVIGWWEFYTEGMTNPDFQAKLKNVTLSGYKGGKKSNVYEEFVKIINNILEKLGFVNKDYSALDEIINATTKVIEKRYGYSVKPGVQELFESNESLANAVYEALGYKSKYKDAAGIGNLIDELKEIKEPYLKELADLFISLNIDIPLYYSKSQEYAFIVPDNTIIIPKNSYGIIKQKSIIHELLHGGTSNKLLSNPNFKSEIESLIKTIKDSDQQGSLTFSYELQSADELISGLSEKSFVNFLKQKGIYDNVLSVVKNNLEFKKGFQITPQQKQEAQQLYSQYLNTIFPDSKVKDILYHNSSAKFDRFRESIFGISLSYSPLKYTYGDIVYNVIVDVKNPLTAPFEGTSEEKRLYSEEYRKYNFPTLTPEGYPVYKYDASIEISSVTKEGFQIRVRTPEQTHILGNQKDIEGFKKFVSGETTKEEAPPFYEMSAEEREERFQDFYNKNQNISEDEAREYFNRCML